MTPSERHQILQLLAYSGEAPDDVAEVAYDELDRMWRYRRRQSPKIHVYTDLIVTPQGTRP